MLRRTRRGGGRDAALHEVPAERARDAIDVVVQRGDELRGRARHGRAREDRGGQPPLPPLALYAERAEVPLPVRGREAGDAFQERGAALAAPAEKGCPAQEQWRDDRDACPCVLIGRVRA